MYLQCLLTFSIHIKESLNQNQFFYHSLSAFCFKDFNFFFFTLPLFWFIDLRHQSSNPARPCINHLSQMFVFLTRLILILNVRLYGWFFFCFFDFLIFLFNGFVVLIPLIKLLLNSDPLFHLRRNRSLKRIIITATWNLIILSAYFICIFILIEFKNYCVMSVVNFTSFKASPNCTDIS